MTGRDRFLAALHHREPDRVAIHDGPWGTTVRRWRSEGLPGELSAAEYFGYELAAAGGDTSFRFATEAVEETESYRIVRDANGALVKNWKDHTGTPEKTDFLIKTRQDWDEHKHRLAMSPERVNIPRAKEAQAQARERGHFFCYSGVVGYDKTQGIIGSVNLLMAMMDQPEWVAEMFMKSADLVVETAEELIGGGVEFDGAFLYDDMGYRNTSLFSPAAYRQLLMPAHRKAFQFFHAKDLKVLMHTCGCVKGLVPDLIEAGLDCLQPLEVKAGMDLIELKKNFGEALAFMGGIDVRCMAHPDPAMIEKEIATKIPCAMKGGGYIYHSDHSVPDNVSFQRYQHVMELVHRYGRY